ncbi:MAG: MOSC domain-containing protein [Undibacterium sp.]|nr:MOSC domain-containing protein [Opitutaceae bacterium]
MQVVISQLFISPGHNFFGRHGLPAGDNPTLNVESIRCRAGWGIEGDRFYGYRPDYKGQVTFFSAETFASVQKKFGLPALSPAVLRRNVVVAGADLNALIGWRFSIGGVSFNGTGEARPCHWMNHAVAPGAEEWLKGRGGLRARVLSDGALQTGAAPLVLFEKCAQPGLATGFIGERTVELRFEGGG